jgi:hypothetical protein
MTTSDRTVLLRRSRVLEAVGLHRLREATP